jgi:predicted Zn-dependent protease
MLLTEDEAHRIAARTLERSRADACAVRISGAERTNLRFARNMATTNGFRSETSVTVTSWFGERSGSAAIASLEDEALDRAAARSEALARLAPPDPEYMPLLGPQRYAPGAGYHAPTAALPAGALADAAGAAAICAEEAGLDGSGFAEAGARFQALANSAGLKAFERRTSAGITISARRRSESHGPGQWSGWAGASAVDFHSLNAEAAAGRAVDKASAKGEAIDLDPGVYTVILEPAATAELVQWLLRHMDARPADEGHSFLSRKGDGTALGEKIFDERVTIYSDPADPAAPGEIFGHEGLPCQRTLWVENGVARSLWRSRFWARKTGRAPTPPARDLVMTGGPVSTDEMIASVKRGVLVTRLWYANVVDPSTLLLTGLTRDGNFLIENGRIVGPARNLRFNESVVAALNNVEAIGPAVRTADVFGLQAGVVAPTLLVKRFRFSSHASGI